MDLPVDQAGKARRAGGRLTLFVLVDALRPDYVSRAPYLKRLAEGGATGVLRECFGFVPRAAYFGGLSAEQYGFTNMYCFDPAESPFSMARALPAAGLTRAVEAQVGIRQVLEQSARDRMPPFAKAYASSAEIPMAFVSSFDLVEKRAPWDKQAGYRSLFAELEEAGLPWYQCSWPETNKLADHTDKGIVQEVLRALRPEHRFAYVHLQELDGVGHAFGPGSAELQSCLASTDGCCEELIEGLRKRYREVDVVLFGDHGMVNVTRTLDVWKLLEGTGLKYGSEYAFFLDSTMARFWFFHARARAAVEKALQAAAGGRVLAEEDLEHYGIAGCDRRNGEMIFLADPGVLIFPNFFQGHGEPIKGMHGYEPDCPDNLGFFLAQSARLPNSAGATVGQVDPPMLFPLLRGLLELPGAGATPPIQIVAREREGRFTSHPDPAAEEMVRTQLEQIGQAVEKRFGRTQALVLTGSFGRGEGGVFRDSQGRYRPVNDYDLLVVDGRELGPELKRLGEELAGTLGIDYVDLGCSDGRWEHLPLSVMHYDLKYGSQVIAGDTAVLERIPAYAAADIPVFEAVKLLLNRSAGLLTGLRGDFLKGVEPRLEARRYLTNQSAKALMAIGDWHLIRWECYDSSYRRRAQRLHSLASGAGLAPRLVSKIIQAYEFKCRPSYEQFGHGLREVAGFYPELEQALVHSINLQTESHARELSQAMTSYVRAMSAPPRGVAEDNARCAQHPELKAMLKADFPGDVSLRHLVYSVLPFLVVSATDERRAGAAFEEATTRLEASFRLPGERSFNPQAWEELRGLVVKAWFAICH